MNLQKIINAIAVVLAVMAGTHCNRAIAAASKGRPHYQLVMSQDDALCKPLTEIYNGLLTRLMKESSKDGEPSPTAQWPAVTDFEVSNPSAFSKAGLMAPIPVQSEGVSFNLYKLDIRGNGDKRLVAVQDLFFEGFIDHTSIYIFKSGITLDSINWIDDPEEVVDHSAIDPKQLDGSADLEYLQKSQQPNSTDSNNPYMLKKWPDFPRFWKNYVIAGRQPYPVIFPRVTIRFFLYNNKNIIFIANNNDQLVNLYKWSNYYLNILVYNIKNNIPSDICYISLDNGN